MKLWCESTKPYMTPGGDPVYECPVCGDHHVYGIECIDHHKSWCNRCGEPLIYPYEKPYLTDKEADCFKDAYFYAKEFLANDSSGHGIDHVMRVCKIAKDIADEMSNFPQNPSIDVFRLLLVALLHEVDDSKLSPSTCANKDNARLFLERYHDVISEKTAENIIDDIARLSFHDGKIPSTIEGKIVQDADRIDAIGAIGIARAFMFGGSHGQPMMSGENSVVDHFYNKLFKICDTMNTDIGKTVAKRRKRFMQQFIQELHAEADH